MTIPPQKPEDAPPASYDFAKELTLFMGSAGQPLPFASIPDLGDREFVLMACSTLEHYLQLILILKIRGGASKKQAAELFGARGPFSGFAAKIAVCSALALLPKDSTQELGILKSIRNEFAHSPHRVLLSDAGMTALCNSLRLADETDGSAPRDKIRGSCQAIILRMAFVICIATYEQKLLKKYVPETLRIAKDAMDLVYKGRPLVIPEP